MNARNRALNRIAGGGVVAVLRGITDENVEEIGDALVDGGIPALEITAETPEAAAKIRVLAEHLADRDVLVGAGTVLDAPTARTMIQAGSQFIVTPTLNEGVIELANRAGVPVVPGIMTPTEAQRALEAGADAVKLFPAKSVGPAHIAAIQAPLPQVDIIPTGGVTEANAADYIAAGAFAVGVGSALVSDELVEQERWEDLEARAAMFVDRVETAKQSSR